MPNHMLVITKTHGVSCNIGIAYTVTSYYVSKLLTLATYATLRYKRDIFNFQSAILRKTSFPKARSSKRKEPAKGNNHRRQLLEYDVSHLKAKAGRRFSGYLTAFCAPCFPSYTSKGDSAIDLRDKRIFNNSIMLKTCIKRVESMLITNASS